MVPRAIVRAADELREVVRGPDDRCEIVGEPDDRCGDLCAHTPLEGRRASRRRCAKTALMYGGKGHGGGREQRMARAVELFEPSEGYRGREARAAVREVAG
jgi:hypothetical protein